MFSPLLVFITYLSAFKNGKFTCDRYLVNHFLYLLTSISIYFTSVKVVQKQKIKLDMMHSLGIGLLVILLLFSFYLIKNTFLQHIMWLLILILLSIIPDYEKYDKDVIEDVFKKSIIIVLICLLIAMKFPKYINGSVHNVLIGGLIFVILFHIIDTFFLKNKYKKLISHISVFVFSGLIIYDTDTVLKQATDCVQPEYLNNMINMFLNIFNLFENLLVLNE